MKTDLMNLESHSRTKSSSEYDADYFERGLESGKSLYTNYRWIPELTIPLAYEFIKILDLKEGEKVLDFGCAKGYLVKALRLLHIDAYGIDASDYAVSNVPAELASYVVKSTPLNCANLAKHIWRAVIAKDVLEHLEKDEIDQALRWFSSCSDKIFVVVPLGDGDKYLVPAYDLDVTHKVRESLDWWKAKIEEFGYRVDAKHSWGHIKESWSKQNSCGNGFLFGVKG